MNVETFTEDLETDAGCPQITVPNSNSNNKIIKWNTASWFYGGERTFVRFIDFFSFPGVSCGYLPSVVMKLR